MANSSENAQESKLIPLSELKDFEVAEGQPDIRGWEVFSAGRHRIGTIQDLLIDSKKLLVRYLNLKLSPEVLPQNETARNVLIPVGSVVLSDVADEASLPSLSTEQVVACPAYTGGPITRQYELRLLAALPLVAAATEPADFYSSTHFADHGFSGPRFRSQEPGSVTKPDA